jgi:O-antigen ligase
MVIPLDRMFLDDLIGIEVPITVTQVVGVFTLLVALTATLFEARLRRFDRTHLYVYLFIIWACLSCLWSQDPDSALSRAITYLQLAIMVWLMTQYGQSREEQRGLMLAYVCGSMIVAVQLLVGYALGGTSFSVELFPGRFTSMGYNPNDLALSLALGIPFAWYCFVGMRSVGSLIGLAYLPIALAAILLSASRGGAFAAIVAMTLVPIGFTKMSHFRKLAVAGSLVVAGIVAAFTVPERSWERLMTIDDEASTRWTIANLENLDLMNMRVAIWKEGLDQFKESPFFGVGAGGYLNVVDPVHGERRVAHNIFLSILVELGLIGLLLFVLMMSMLLVSTRHLPPDERLTWVFVLGTYLVGGLFLSWEHTKQTWMIVGLLAGRFAVVRVPRKPKRQEIPNETRQVIARHIERQKWDKAREIVIDVLITRNEVKDTDTIDTFFDRLSELNDEWPNAESVAAYFEERLSYVPPSVVEWRGLAEEWSEQLRRLLVSDF